MEQIPISLSYRPAFNREDFLVTSCNKEAVVWIDSYPNWGFHCIIIQGGQGSGKTHLASVFSDQIFQAYHLTIDDIPNLPDKFVLEDIDCITDERILFHLFNDTKEKGKMFLMTTRKIPVWSLPDLKSRLSSIPIIPITAPDDVLIMSILYKSFKDRQIQIDTKVLSYLLRHIERSFYTIQRIVMLADNLSLTQKRRLTIPLIKEAMTQLEEEKLF